MTADALPWLILGAGRAGRMLALWAAQLGLPVAATWSRSASSASVAALTLPHILQHASGPLPGALSRLPPRPYMVWITVADDAIAPCAAAIAAWLPEGSRVAHMAGSLPSSILSDAGITAPIVPGVMPVSNFNGNFQVPACAVPSMVSCMTAKSAQAP